MVTTRFFITFTLLAIFTLLLNAQEIEVISSGQGKTEEEATRIALRNALEDSYGTFISSSSIISNDILVSDEIISLVQGNIKKYKILNSNQLPDMQIYVTVKSIVALNKLSDFCQSNGMNIKFEGASLAMNIEQQIFNAKNEEKIINNIKEQILRMMNNVNIYNYKVESINTQGENIQLKISATENQNGKLLYDLLFNTLASIKLNRNQKNTLDKLAIDYHSLQKLNKLHISPTFYLALPFSLGSFALFLLPDGNYEDNFSNGMSGLYYSSNIYVRSYNTRNTINELIQKWNGSLIKYKLIDNNGVEYNFSPGNIKHKKTRKKNMKYDSPYLSKTKHIFTYDLELPLDKIKKIKSFDIIPL